MGARKGNKLAMSKFPLDILQKAVFPYAESQDPDVLLGAAFGEDVALTKVGNCILASHVDPIVGAISNIGWLAVHVACNDIATSGIAPRWILLLVLVPRLEDVDLLQSIMRDARKATSELSISIIGGHTGYSAGLSRPLVAVTALGTLVDREPIYTGGAQHGDRILVTKGLALEGTAILAEDFKDVARELGLTQTELEEARTLIEQVSVVPEALALVEHGTTAIRNVTRGGLLETLLETAHLSQVQLKVEVSRLPINPIVTRFAQLFQFDPISIISSGTLVATIPPSQSRIVSQALDAIGIPFSFVGEVLEGFGVELHEAGEVIRHTEIQPEKDELARMWELYPRQS